MSGSGVYSDRQDLWVWWSFIPVILFPIYIVVASGFFYDLRFMSFLVVPLLWGAVVISFAAFAVLAAIDRLWRRLISFGVFPLASFVMAVNYSALMDRAVSSGRDLHFWAMRGAYQADIAKIPFNGGHRVAVFDWGDDLTTLDEIIYDEADQIALPKGRRSAEWRRAVFGTEEDCDVWSRPMGDHFYFAQVVCGAGK
jgi:hypothetical protein